MATSGAKLSSLWYYGMLLRVFFVFGCLFPTWACPRMCTCKGDDMRPKVYCAGRNLTSLPENIGGLTIYLDLSHNQIWRLPDYCFSPLKYIQKLLLVDNHLSTLPPRLFDSILNLYELYLDRNYFQVVPAAAFQSLTSLERLHLEWNQIYDVPEDSFITMSSLQHLWLRNNHLSEVPSRALSRCPSLKALTLAENYITSIPKLAFQKLRQLEILILYKNRITTISPWAFHGLTSLYLLELDDNFLTEIPTISSLRNMTELSLIRNRIIEIPRDSFLTNQRLRSLYIADNPIAALDAEAFNYLPNLEMVVLSGTRYQHTFPQFAKSRYVRELFLDNGALRELPENICRNLTSLVKLDLQSNQIVDLTNLSQCTSLQTMNAGHNLISLLRPYQFRGADLLQDIILSYNHIRLIGKTAFFGLHHLEHLDLQHNAITTIHLESFAPLTSLRDLNLAENSFDQLPTLGLSNLASIKTYGVETLIDFPEPHELPRVRELTLNYAYHCCPYIKQEENVSLLTPSEAGMIVHANLSDFSDGFLLPVGVKPTMGNENYSEIRDFLMELAQQDLSALHPTGTFLEPTTFLGESTPLNCKPLPGPFLPCEDLLEWWTLRSGIWIIFILSVIGNSTVLVVNIMTVSSRLDVPKFLISNLAAANLCMSIYLGILAITDVTSLGMFRRRAIWWQRSWGCRLAGVLAVLSGELSVITLTLVTLERYWTIVYAVQLEKRLTLKQAAYTMVAGWFVSLILAFLPLMGVSDYRKFSICLPFEIGDPLSLGYVCFLMLMTLLAFVTILLCYVRMFCDLRRSPTWMESDYRVAKRMSILVFTDFLCWAPVAFLGLTAVFGWSLLSPSDSKILVVFVLPLNSSINPFLYGIFTANFKKDWGLFCRRWTEREGVTQGHSPYSNRRVGAAWNSTTRGSWLNSLFPSLLSLRRSAGSTDEGQSTEVTRPMTANGIDTAHRSTDIDELDHDTNLPSVIGVSSVRPVTLGSEEDAKLEYMMYWSGEPTFTGHFVSKTDTEDVDSIDSEATVEVATFTRHRPLGRSQTSIGGEGNTVPRILADCAGAEGPSDELKSTSTTTVSNIENCPSRSRVKDTKRVLNYHEPTRSVPLRDKYRKDEDVYFDLNKVQLGAGVPESSGAKRLVNVIRPSQLALTVQGDCVKVISDRNKKLHMQHAGIDDVTAECTAGHSTVCICASCTCSKQSQKPTSGLEHCPENLFPLDNETSESDSLICPHSMRSVDLPQEDILERSRSPEKMPTYHSDQNIGPGHLKVTALKRGLDIDTTVLSSDVICETLETDNPSRRNASYVFFVSKPTGKE